MPGTADLSQDRNGQALRIKTVCLLARAARLSTALESGQHFDLPCSDLHPADAYIVFQLGSLTPHCGTSMMHVIRQSKKLSARSL